MMTTHIRYLTHPQVKIEPAVPVPSWGLSDVGRTRTEALANAGWLSETTQIISSSERKAIETAAIIAGELKVTVEVLDAMHENDRSTTGFLAPDEFETVADQFFAHPLASIRGWERAIDAQLRIVREVERVTCCSSATAPSVPFCSVTIPVSRLIESMINPPAAATTSRWSRIGDGCCIHGVGWRTCLPHEASASFPGRTRMLRSLKAILRLAASTWLRSHSLTEKILRVRA